MREKVSFLLWGQSGSFLWWTHVLFLWRSVLRHRPLVSAPIRATGLSYWSLVTLSELGP